MDLTDYLKDEIEEENALGYLSDEERARRVALLAAGGSPQTDAVDSPPGESFDDESVHAEWVEFDGDAGPLHGYRAAPRESTPRAGVIVVHENKGLVPYVQDVARRLARVGFLALAPDLLSRAGGTASFADAAEVTAALGKISPDDLVADLRSSVGRLIADDALSGRPVGALGFCFGGGMVWRLITKERRLSAAVPFYGPNPPLEDVPAIETPVFAVYGELDERITSRLPEIEAAMKEHGKTFEKTVLPGAQHAFHNDTNPDRYNPEAATQAWDAAIEHLRTWLGA